VDVYGHSKDCIYEGYGITECSPVVSVNPKQKIKPGSVGKILEDIKIKIINPETSEVYGPGQVGLILISGDNVFNGYLEKEMDEAAFKIIDGVKYFISGDLGYVDSDNYLYIVGRLKRFVKVSGEMISLPEAENILSSKFTDDKRRLALEAKEKDGKVKFVLFSNFQIDKNEANEILRNAGISNLLKISEVRVLDELPILGSGKIDYKVLKAQI